jgi:hypothetical protein
MCNKCVKKFKHFIYAVTISLYEMMQYNNIVVLETHYGILLRLQQDLLAPTHSQFIIHHPIIRIYIVQPQKNTSASRELRTPTLNVIKL